MFETQKQEMSRPLLAGKVALVTGAARGLGAAICKMLCEQGATVVLADIREALARETASELDPDGARTQPIVLDVCSEAQVESAVREIQSKYGRLDVLVNNAGTDKTVSVAELAVEDWDHILATNLRGPFILSKHVFPVMQTQGGGHIVNIVSTASKRAWPNAAAYHASKWGLLGFSHALHTEARPHGIKVSAIIVGGMRTQFLLERFPDIDQSTLQDPANVAETVRFVLSQPLETVIPEVMVLPMRESSWP